MEKNNRPDLKQRTKEWLNKYGKYIFIAVALLSFLAVAFSIKSYCAPAGGVHSLDFDSNASCISNISFVYQDGEMIVIPCDDSTFGVQSFVYLFDETRHVDVYTEYYEADPDYPGDFTYYGTYLSAPSAAPAGVGYFSFSTRPYIIQYGDNFAYQPFDYIYVGNDEVFTIYDEYCTIRFHVEYYDSNATVFADEDIEIDDYSLGEYPPVLTYDDLDISLASQSTYLGVSMHFSCDVPTSISVPTPTNFDIVEAVFYESDTLTAIRVEQPVYTDFNIISIITDAINGLFSVEWLGGITLGSFFGLCIAIPVMFFVFKAFLGG